MNINSNGSNFISSYFNSVNRFGSSSGSFSFLSDYASIRNGSYAKLLRAYYGKPGSSSSSTSSSNTNNTNKTDKLTTQDKTSLSTTKSAASKLTSTAQSLYRDASLFKKKDIETKNEDGTKTTTNDYDRDAIYDKVNGFISSYNSMIKASGSTSNSSVERATKNLTNQTAVYQKQLAKAGITINSDNTLSIDKNAFKKAEISTVKNLFSGSVSFAAQVANKSSSVSNYASGYLSNSSLYTNRATTYMDNSSNYMNSYF